MARLIDLPCHWYHVHILNMVVSKMADNNYWWVNSFRLIYKPCGRFKYCKWLMIKTWKLIFNQFANIYIFLLVEYSESTKKIYFVCFFLPTNCVLYHYSNKTKKLEWKRIGKWFCTWLLTFTIDVVINGKCLAITRK